MPASCFYRFYPVAPPSGSGMRAISVPGLPGRRSDKGLPLHAPPRTNYSLRPQNYTAVSSRRQTSASLGRNRLWPILRKENQTPGDYILPCFNDSLPLNHYKVSLTGDKRSFLRAGIDNARTRGAI